MESDPYALSEAVQAFGLSFGSGTQIDLPPPKDFRATAPRKDAFGSRRRLRWVSRHPGEAIFPACAWDSLPLARLLVALASDVCWRP